MGARGVPQNRYRQNGLEVVDAGIAFLTHQPVRCGRKGCKRWAVVLDTFAPYHLEMSRCREHARDAQCGEVKP